MSNTTKRVVSLPDRPTYPAAIGPLPDPTPWTHEPALVFLSERVRSNVEEDLQEVVDHEQRAVDERHVGGDGFRSPRRVPNHGVDVGRVRHHAAVVAEGVEAESPVALAKAALPDTPERYVVIYHLIKGAGRRREREREEGAVGGRGGINTQRRVC